ncbi:NRR repressor homolog 3-like [Curcuma longa]|uniref:NRR repressor homolog 3-like n=1 Tax=Curcuma longa TaxID=136217 RepID=UPI003D9DE886
MEQESSKSARRKRAAEEDEDSDMEKFYALLENITAMRDLLRKNSSCSNRLEPKALPRPSVWKPKFELEDFAEESGGCVRRQRNRREEEGKEKEEEEPGEQKMSLDLRFSL